VNDRVDLTLRQLIDRALIRLDEGSPRAFVRVNLLNAIKRLDQCDRAFVAGNDIGDYCPDCGTPIRLGNEPHTWGSATPEIAGRFVPDPMPEIV
jgi:hypothetical protein